MDIQRLLQNRDLQTTILIFFIALSLIQFLEQKLLISVIVLIMLLINSSKLLELSDTKDSIKQDIKTDEISDDMYYNTSVHNILLELKQFKKYNRPTYKQGVKYMRRFFRTLKVLEHADIQNRNQYFDLSKDYLKQAINHFQSISVSIPERNLIDGIKYGDYEITAKTNQLSSVIKQLHRECMNILLNIGIVFNQEWAQNPDIYTTEIDLNTQGVEHYNKFNEVHWTLY